MVEKIALWLLKKIGDFLDSLIEKKNLYELEVDIFSHLATSLFAMNTMLFATFYIIYETVTFLTVFFPILFTIFYIRFFIFIFHLLKDVREGERYIEVKRENLKYVYTDLIVTLFVFIVVLGVFFTNSHSFDVFFDPFLRVAVFIGFLFSSFFSVIVPLSNAMKKVYKFVDGK